MPRPGVILRAVDLLRKDGFEGGSAVDDVLDDNGFDSLARPTPETDENCLDPGLGGAVLGECVRRYLAPKLIGFEIAYGLSVSHNPVRLAEVDGIDLAGLGAILEGLEAIVSYDDILAVAEGMAAGYAAARRG